MRRKHTPWMFTAAMVGLSLCSCTMYRPESLPLYVGPAQAPAAKGAAEAAPAAGAAARPGPTAPPAAAEGPIELATETAILMALENNQELVVQKINPEIVRTAEDRERGVFDPLLKGSLGRQRERGKVMNFEGATGESVLDSIVGDAGVLWAMPTGTTLEAGASTAIVDASAAGTQLVRARLGMTATQALLRGFGPEVNLARIRQARLDTLASEYELRGFAETLVARVEQTYWDYVLASREMEIYNAAIELAEQQLRAIRQRVDGGTAPASELAAAEAEIALRREDMVDVRRDLDTSRVRLLRLLNPPGPNPFQREIAAAARLVLPEATLEDVESHVQVGLKMRPELNQARLGIQRGDLEIVRTRNGLLPKMDLFVAMGRSGYAESFGNAWGDVWASHYDLLFGVKAEYPAGNRAARADYQRAVLTRRHSEEAVKNLEQLVQEDIRTSYIAAQRARDKVAAAAVTRALDEKKLQVQMEMWLDRRATSFQVARAQRDLVKDQIVEVQATAAYLKAVVELYRLEGSLLTRRGIGAPGESPITGRVPLR